MLDILTACALLFVVWKTLETINQMGKKTRHTVRMAYLVIAWGALLGLHDIMTGERSPTSNLIILLGLVLYFLANKRTHYRDKRHKHEF